MQQDYYSALSGLIMASARDDPQLRRNIYELARSKLRRRLDWESSALSPTERALQLQALETAIEHVEADLAGNAPRHVHSATNTTTEVAHAAVEIIPPARHRPPPPEPRLVPAAERAAARSRSSAARSLLPLLGAAILGVATYVAVEREVYKESAFNAQADTEIARGNSSSGHPPAMPIPSGYGVYALTNDKLIELEPLPVRIPDRGVTISGAVSTASRTSLPNGRAQFVIFKRDLVNNVPEKIVVRVVAKVMRPAKPNRKDEASADDGGDMWIIRNTSYEMKVAPVEGKPAMIVARPADADFSFPAGRYALVLKGAAYDFSVAGPITDSAQCVERSDDASAQGYAQCRRP